MDEALAFSKKVRQEKAHVRCVRDIKAHDLGNPSCSHLSFFSVAYAFVVQKN